MLLTKKRTAPAARTEVNPLDVYLFDCSGLVVVRNVFPASQIEAAKQAITKVYPNKKPWKFSVLSMGEIFWDIMTNKTLLGMAEQFCGQFSDKNYAMDHSNTRREKTIS